MPSPAFSEASPLPAPAKVNLGLHVLARRADGYHEVETVMLSIGWADALAAAPAHDLSLTCSDAALPTDGGNLVVRAAEALADWAGIAPRARLHLDKHVPYGAGLGSGSSDAAAALRLLARLWNLDVPRDAMHALAASLGSDVPFFLDGVPALATGRGEILTPLDVPPMPFVLTVVVPPVHVPTAAAYGLLAPRADGRPDLAAVVASADPERWRRELVNDFQAPVEAAYPAVGDARQALEAAGARYAALSGSGSAVVGVFDTPDEAQAAADDAETNGAQVWVGRPLGYSPSPA